MLLNIDFIPGRSRNHEPKDQTALSQDQAPNRTSSALLEESASLPQEIPIESDAPVHSAESVRKKYPPRQIGDTLIVTDVGEMTSALEGSAGAGNYHVCKVTLSGPLEPAAPFSPFNPRTWGTAKSQQLELEMHIGSEQCPDWNHANKCLAAILHLVTLQDGYLNEAVTAALTTHLGAKVTAPRAPEAA
jgi:hypothetical protein